MQPLEKLVATSIPEVVRSSATAGEVDRWLAEPTETVCSQCGQQALQRYEALNGRCERCRVAYLEASGVDLRSDGCASCQGTGWQTRDLAARSTRYSLVRRCESCSPGDDELIMQKLRLAGVLPEYRVCTWTTWNGNPPPEARQFAAYPDKEGVLYIYGLQGRGKTHCATATLRELLERGVSCQWRDCKQLVQQCREWIARGADDPLDEEILRLRQAGVLLLDDLGAERQTDYGVDILDGLIRYRHSRQLPMIVTSNRSLKGLVTPQGEGGLGREPAVASRLRGLEVHLEGPDRRARTERTQEVTA